MPRDVSGNTQPLPGTIVSTGDTILPSQHNPMVNDVYAMMTQSLSRDGQGGMRAPLDMSNFRIINVGTATLPSDAVSLAQFQTGTPIGVTVDFAGANAPSTWLLCHGQAISRTSYAALFSVIGTTYGVGDGTSTFNLPDYRGRVSAGKDNMGGTSSNRLISNLNGSILGAAGGNEGHLLTISEMPSHSHSGTTSSSGDHTHQIGSNDNAAAGTLGLRSGNTVAVFNSNNTLPAGDHFHSFTTQTSGGGAYHNNVQPTIITNKIIKALY